MPAVRTPRSEKNTLTTRRLLDAAGTVFARDGIGRASMDDVAAHAGLSKGSLYYRYATKADLLEAVLEDRARARVRELADVAFLAGVSETAAGVRAQRIADHLVAVLGGDETWAALLSELVVYARSDPRYGPILTRHLADVRDAVTMLIQTRADDLGAQLPITAERLAVTLIALAQGLAMERTIDPDATPDNLLANAVSLLLTGVAVAARRGGVAPPAHARRATTDTQP